MNKTFNKFIVALLIASLFVFPMAGCVKSATPIVEITPQGDLKFTPTPEIEMTESMPRVSPYIKVMVVDVEIRYLETNPVQVELVIRGTLPDQCKYGFYSVENRGDQNVKVSLDGIHPSDNSCLQTNQSIEYVLCLGRDMPESERGFSPGDYKLTVNNYQTSFSIK
jgi:hypothetical protein